MEPIEFSPKRWKLALIVLLAVVFVLGSVWLLSDYRQSGSTEELIAGFLGAIVFIPLTFITLRESMHPRARVIFSEEGLYVFKQGDRPFPWTSIRVVYVSQIRSTKFVSLEFENEAELAANDTAWRRNTIRMNRRMGMGRVNISVTALGISPAAMCSMILERVQAARSARATSAVQFGWSTADRR